MSDNLTSKKETTVLEITKSDEGKWLLHAVCEDGGRWPILNSPVPFVVRDLTAQPPIVPHCFTCTCDVCICTSERGVEPTCPVHRAAVTKEAPRHDEWVDIGPDGKPLRTADETTPPHLRDDAPYKQCSECGRKSWEAPSVQAICWMPQPDGSKCQGVLRPVSEFESHAK